MCFVFLLGPAPFFVASLFCFEAKRKSGWGICGSFLVVVVLLFFVCLWFRDDLPKFLDHTCPCTLLLFTAYAIVRTEPSANRPNRREKRKKNAVVAAKVNWWRTDTYLRKQNKTPQKQSKQTTQKTSPNSRNCGK